jgi:hypothetical protein
VAGGAETSVGVAKLVAGVARGAERGKADNEPALAMAQREVIFSLFSRMAQCEVIFSLFSRIRPEEGKKAAVAAETVEERASDAGRGANEGTGADKAAGGGGGTAGAVMATPRRTGAERWSEGEAKAAVATESSK